MINRKRKAKNKERDLEKRLSISLANFNFLLQIPGPGSGCTAKQAAASVLACDLSWIGGKVVCDGAADGDICRSLRAAISLWKKKY